mmetsp:Transcript_523/g.1232  ORF Transcript_523/g.1232 Transcript_523/m.1232 type:complete len:224 (+) Transcript_523:757-1428(+)
MRPTERTIAGKPAHMLTSLASDGACSSSTGLPLDSTRRRVAEASSIGRSSSRASFSPNCSTMWPLRVVIRTVTRPPASHWKGVGCASFHTSSRMIRQRLSFRRRATSSRTESVPCCSNRARSSGSTPSSLARRESCCSAVRFWPNSSQKMPSQYALRTIGSRASHVAVVVLPSPALPAIPVTWSAPTMPTSVRSPRTLTTRASRRSFCSGRGWKCAGSVVGTS